MEEEKEFYTHDEICHVLGLEKSRIRFIEREFGAYFGFTRLSPFPTLYTRKQFTLIKKINHLLNRPDLNVAQIKAEFQRLCLERGKGVWVLAVTSGKGGVGKTSLAVNISVMLAKHGVRTTLFDADFGLANAHIFLGINPVHSIADLLNRRASVEEILMDGPCGMKLIPGGSGILQLAELDESSRTCIIDELTQLRKMTDVLVIDTSAGVSRNVLRFIGLADEVLTIATPNIASTLDAFGLIRIAVQQKVPGNINLIVNRVKNRSQSDQVFTKLAQCADDFLGEEVNNIGYVFEDSNIEKAIQYRTPLLNLCPDSPALLCIEEIVQRLLQKKKIWKGGRKNKFHELFSPIEV
jgi:flagellar biosynthesis protein FlhG